jgi:carbon-monoxide dehydrogenase medium subunit
VGDYATAGVAAQVTLGSGGTVERAGLGSDQPRSDADQGSRRRDVPGGKRPDAATLSEAGQRAAKASSPSADRRGSVEYKREMARVLATRALKIAVERAGGR